MTLSYIVECLNIREGSKVHCEQFFVIHERNADEPNWPPADWKASVACTKCKHFWTYQADEVAVEEDYESQALLLADDQSRTPPGLWTRVRVECATCDAPLAFYVPAEKTKEQVRREDYVGTCPNGHEVTTNVPAFAPGDKLSVSSCSGPLPSRSTEMLGWVPRSGR